jgi:hypothetical protein
MDTTATFKIISPVIWLAAVAFMVGFIGYLALGLGATAVAHSHPRPHAAMVSGPASEAWNLPKHI